jgi:hypothetical protein
VQDLVAAAAHFDVGHVAQLHESSIDAAQLQAPDLCDAVARLRCEHDDQVDGAIALIDLRNFRAVVGGTDRLERIQRRESHRGRALLPKPHDDLRRPRRRLHLYVHSFRHARQHRGDALRIAIEQVQIVAVQIDHQRCSEAGDGLLDALGEKGVDRKRHAGELALTLAHQRFADLVQDAHLLFAVERADLDLEFAVVRAERVRAIGRTADPLRNRAHTLDRADCLRDAIAHAQGLGFRGPGHGGHVNDVVSLAQRRNELAGEQRQQRNP